MTTRHEDDVALTVIIVSYNTIALIGRCLSALREATEGLRVQVVIVDNNSRDGSAELLRTEHADCDLILNDVNVGFGRASNQGAAIAHGRYVLLLNPDAFVSDRSVHLALSYLDEHPLCGVAGARLTRPDGSLQPSCRYFPTPWNEFLTATNLGHWVPATRLIDDMAWDHRTTRRCDWVPGCFLMTRRELVEQFGLFDPRFFLYYEEVDYCRRLAAAGWGVTFLGFVEVVHIGGESARSDVVISDGGRQNVAVMLESWLLYHRNRAGFLGAAAALASSTMADMVLAFRGMANVGRWGSVKRRLAHSVTVFRVARFTHFGTRPTR